MGQDGLGNSVNSEGRGGPVCVGGDTDLDQGMAQGLWDGGWGTQVTVQGPCSPDLRGAGGSGA